jgi:hypothetical protein
VLRVHWQRKSFDLVKTYKYYLAISQSSNA